MKPPRLPDDDSLAESVQVVLETNGYEVMHVDDGREGLKYATQGDFDMVLTDFKMPGMAGTELLEKILATKPQLPVVLMTAFLVRTIVRREDHQRVISDSQILQSL